MEKVRRTSESASHRLTLLYLSLIHISVAELDPDLAHLLAREEQRQATTIILIASESEAPEAVGEALTSAFGNIYAEGYPREESRQQTEAEILDLDMELAHYRRYSDPRYYKGVELSLIHI